MGRRAMRSSFLRRMSLSESIFCWRFFRLTAALEIREDDELLFAEPCKDE